MNSAPLTLSEAVEKAQYFMDGFGQPYPDITPASRRKRRLMLEEEFKAHQESPSRSDRLKALCNMLYIVATATIAEGVGLKDYSPKTVFNRETPMSLQQQFFFELFLFWQRTANLQQTELHKKVASTLLRSAAIILLEAGQNNFYNFRDAFLATHAAQMKKVWGPDEITTDHKFHTINGQKIAFDDFGKIIKPPSWVVPKYHQYLDPPAAEYKEVLPGVPKVVIRRT